MNVYDFDETIYDGDSTRDFCIYLYTHYPKTWLALPRQLKALVCYMTGSLDKTGFKEAFFSMFRYVRDIDAALDDFWNSHDDRVLEYYLAQKSADDVVVSASPEFIIAPLCKRLGLKHIIGSHVDKRTGLFDGPNCYGEEKVARFEAAGFEKAAVEKVYSDSLSDTPLARMGKEAHIVTKDGLTDWVAPKQSGMQAFFTLFNKPAALVAIAAGAVNILTAGHVAKLVVREKKSCPSCTYGVLAAVNTASLVVLLKNTTKGKAKLARTTRAFTTVSVPVVGFGVGVTAAVFALTGMPVLALGAACVLSVPMMYKGVALFFRKEIAEEQAKKGQVE